MAFHLPGHSLTWFPGQSLKDELCDGLRESPLTLLGLGVSQRQHEEVETDGLFYKVPSSFDICHLGSV